MDKIAAEVARDIRNQYTIAYRPPSNPSGEAHRSSLHPGPKKEHVQRLLAADFTPPKVPDAVFDTITVPATATRSAHIIFINAPAVQTDASVLTLGTKKQKQSMKAQVVSII